MHKAVKIFSWLNFLNIVNIISDIFDRFDINRDNKVNLEKFLLFVDFCNITINENNKQLINNQFFKDGYIYYENFKKFFFPQQIGLNFQNSLTR